MTARFSVVTVVRGFNSPQDGVNVIRKILQLLGRCDNHGSGVKIVEKV